MTLQEIFSEFQEKTPNSKKAFIRANQSIAGGVTANIKYFDPYPIFMKSGKGAWLTDLDGNKYVDYVLSYGPLILGHGREEILEEFNSQFQEHSSYLYGTPSEIEAEFAENLSALLGQDPGFAGGAPERGRKVEIPLNEYRND